MNLGFCTNPLDRAILEHEADAIRALDAPDRLVMVVWGDSIAIDPRGGRATARWSPDAVPPGVPSERTLLGPHEGRPVTAILIEPATPDRPADEPALRFADLRSAAVKGLLPEEELGMLAQAKALFNWHRRHRFCSNCGAATASSALGTRRDCPSCGAQHFPRTDPVAIMLVTRGDSCLLGRSGRFNSGMYSCLAGFISPGETIEAAVRREVFEEAGIRVGAVRYVMSQPWPFPSSLMIGCHGEAVSDELTIDRTELEDARWFPRDEVRQMMEGRHPDGLSTPVPIAIAHHLIRGWLAAA